MAFFGIGNFNNLGLNSIEVDTIGIGGGLLFAVGIGGIGSAIGYEISLNTITDSLRTWTKNIKNGEEELEYVFNYNRDTYFKQKDREGDNEDFDELEDFFRNTEVDNKILDGAIDVAEKFHFD